MNKIIVSLLLLAIATHATAQQNLVSNLPALIATTNVDEMIFVKDPVAGGHFVHQDSAAKVDSGIVFVRKAGGYWVRHFDRAQGVNPCWWGAKGDGINDDLPALNAATKYCLANQTILQFPSGIFRITAPWIIGGKTVDEKELFAGQLAETASFKMDQHRIARSASPLIVRGGIKTCIYGDFTASKLTAIVYYNIRAMGAPAQPSVHLYTHEFSNIGIYGKGYFNQSTPTPPDTINTQNKQIGLVMLFCTNSKIDGCGFFGLRYGIVFKTAYFGTLKNCAFEWCHTGIATFDYNSNIIENVNGYYCKLLLDLNGSQIVVNNLNAESCESTLFFKGGNVVFNGIYCENYNLKLPNKYQLVFGKSESDTGYDKRHLTSGIILNGVTIATGDRDAVLLQDDLKQVNINGGSIYGNITTTKPENRVVLKNVDGTYKVTGPGKVERD